MMCKRRCKGIEYSQVCAGCPGTAFNELAAGAWRLPLPFPASLPGLGPIVRSRVMIDERGLTIAAVGFNGYLAYRPQARKHSEPRYRNSWFRLQALKQQWGRPCFYKLSHGPFVLTMFPVFLRSPWSAVLAQAPSF